MDHKTHIINIVNLVTDLFSQNPNLSDFSDNVNSNDEKSIAMDLFIENSVIDYIKSNHLPYKIFAEEGGEIREDTNSEYLITFDPLDGSSNYAKGKNLLPYGFLISIFSNLQPKMSDVVCAAALDYTNHLAWIYYDKQTYTFPTLQPVNISTKIDFDAHTPVYIDLYRKKSYDKYAQIAEKLFIRNTGSTIGNLSLTLSGASTALAGSIIKPEEVGAIYALINGAKGKVTSESGHDFSKIDYSTSRTYDIIAGNPTIVEFILSQLND